MATKAIMVVLMLISTIICCCAMQDKTKDEKRSLVRSAEKKEVMRAPARASAVLSASGDIIPDQAVGADMAPESATVTSHAAIGLAMKKRAGGGSGSHSTQSRGPATLDEVVVRKEQVDKLKSIEHGNCMAAVTSIDGDTSTTVVQEVACPNAGSTVVINSSLKWKLDSCDQVKLKDVDQDVCMEACPSTKNTYGRSCVTSLCTAASSPFGSLTDADSHDDNGAHSKVLDESLGGGARAGGGWSRRRKSTSANAAMEEKYKLQQWSSAHGRIYTKHTYDDDTATSADASPTHYCLTSAVDDPVVQAKPCCKLPDASAFVQDHETHLDESLVGKSSAFGKTCNNQERADQHWELAA